MLSTDADIQFFNSLSEDQKKKKKSKTKQKQAKIINSFLILIQKSPSSSSFPLSLLNLT